MKSLVGFLIAFCVSMSALAESTPPKSFLADVIEAMAQEYLKNLVKDTAAKNAEMIASRALNTEVSGSIATALSVYNFVQDVNTYNDASTETQRYQATAHATADAVSAVNPAVGAIVQLVVLAQDLSAAYLYKDYAIKFAQMREQIIHLQRLRSDLINKEFQAEDKAFRKVLAQAAAANQLATVAGTKITDQCGREEDLVSRQAVMNCFGHYQRYLSIARIQKDLLRMLLDFQGRFINIPSLLSGEDMADSFKEYTASLQKAERSIAEGQRAAAQIMRMLSDDQMRSIQSQLQRNRLAMSCEREILVLLAKLNENRRSYILEKSIWIVEAIDENNSDLRDLLNVTCSLVLDKIDPDILSLTLQRSRQL